jgi:hypothetical protein
MVYIQLKPVFPFISQIGSQNEFASCDSRTPLDVLDAPSPAMPLHTRNDDFIARLSEDSSVGSPPAAVPEGTPVIGILDKAYSYNID